MSAIDRQRNWGDKLQQRNREYDREFLRNKRIEEDRAFAREDRGMKLEDRERRLQREEEDRLLALEQKELGLDKGYSEMAKRDFEEDQRALPYAQTRDAEKKVFEHKFAMEKQKAKLENDIKKAKKLAKAKGKNRPKESEFKAGGFAKRARLAEKDLKNLRADIGTDYTDAIQEWVPEVFKTDERKLFEQAKNNFISAVLRKESGAAISDEEYARENAKYFPSAGDGKNVIKQKERAREQAMLNLEAEGERALEFIGQAEREDQEGMGGMGAKEVDKSLPMMNDAEASGELKLKAEKFNRLQELRRKAQGGN